jgi:hypothetical protein
MKHPARKLIDQLGTAKWWGLLACVLTTLALASPSSAAVNALIVGKLQNCGGPPRHGGHSSCFLQPRAVVSAFNAQRRLVAKETITNGHFSFWLSPGTYTLRAKTSDSRKAKRSATVKAHQTVHANLVFHIH